MLSIRPLALLVTVLCPWLHAADLEADFATADGVPVTADGYLAAGKTIAFNLSHAPLYGAELMVIRNTSASFIEGEFENLHHGQRVELTHHGETYPFIANYHGGTGNDLILQWADTRLASWGHNGDGQLGQETFHDSQASVPGPAAASMLYGKTITAAYAGSYNGAAATADGGLFAWGRGDLVGRTDGGGSSVRALPRPVDTSGVLAGKTVISIAGGFSHIAVLTSDGNVASWGTNAHGQIGNNTTNSDFSFRVSVPVKVTESPAIAGKQMVAISCGTFHTTALCSDGTVVGWGRNDFGSLGNGTYTPSAVPVAVSRTGALAGKTVIAISTGRDHTLALCSDNTLVAWGMGGSGQLGINSTENSNVPVIVPRNGALSGKTIKAIAAGGYHSMVLCSDGTVVTWGDNSSGALGNNSSASSSLVPVAVSQTGVLASRTVVEIAAGQYHSTATCSDGTITAWGANNTGNLGNNSTASLSRVPVLVNRSTLQSGERFVRNFTGSLSSHNLAIVATQPSPVATLLAANPIEDHAATLNGLVTAQRDTLSISFEYGLTTAYGQQSTATPATATGPTATPVSARITGLAPGTTYHYRIIATGPRGTLRSADMTFTTTMGSALTELGLAEAEISPEFSANTLDYHATVPVTTSEVSVRFATANPGAVVTINGKIAESSPTPVAVDSGLNRVLVQVTAPNASSSRSYLLQVVRVPAVAQFTAPNVAPLRATTFSATGPAPQIQVNFAPTAGLRLTLVDQTGGALIQGEFDGMPHGSIVSIPYQGTVYRFVANYRGGDGNDLTLQWANTRLVGWGNNDRGQVGLGNSTSVLRPTAMPVTKALEGKSLFYVGSNRASTASLAFDHSIAIWGGTPPTAPTPLPQSPILDGNQVIQMTAGTDFHVALLSDGTLATWGKNEYGQLGTGAAEGSATPVAVDMSGALAGKRVVRIATGGYHTLALCADGTLAAWGYNAEGQLGDGTRGNIRRAPVLVDRSTALAGKQIVSLTLGSHHSLVQCADGTVAGWGRNDYGQLGVGRGGPSEYPSPVRVDPSGALIGKTIVQMVAGGSHTLVLDSNGEIIGWGYNRSGSVGVNHTSDVYTPAAVVMSGPLAGKKVVEIAAGGVHSYAHCTDGTLASWGGNSTGELGLGDLRDRLTPTPLSFNESVSSVFAQAASGTVHALLAIPLPTATTLAASSISANSARVNGTASGNGSRAQVAFEYGTTPAYGQSLPAAPPGSEPTGTQSFSLQLDNLEPATVYHFRTQASSPSGVVSGADVTFRTLNNDATLAAVEVMGSHLSPQFSPDHTEYAALMPYGATHQTLTVTPTDSNATVRMGGTVGNSTQITPAVGTTRISIEVTAEDGTLKTYHLALTRLPETFRWNAASDVPAQVAEIALPSLPANFSLEFHPLPGTQLTVIHHTGLAFIRGTFSNLAQGQRITLEFDGKSYPFVADYYGGTGNDLVLRWAESAAFAWGPNRHGRLGSEIPQAYSAVPLAVDTQGVLADKVITALSAGYLHSLALCSDGTIASWGYNHQGQLGNGDFASSTLPVAVDRSGPLAGKTVVAITSGPYHNLALCSDGRVVAWGSNLHGQLGNGTQTSSATPVEVAKSGALAGKSVVAIAAGHYQSFALCDDGTIAAWGYNDEGQLGDGTTHSSLTPVAVAGALAGKVATSLTVGSYHAVAHCADGALVVWGYNHFGQLGNGSSTDAPTPQLLSFEGALTGKTVVAVRAGADHTLALCSDGSLAAWGKNHAGQLGDGTTHSRSLPVAVHTTNAMTEKALVSLAAGLDFSQALATDGTLFAWGNPREGALGHGLLENHSPVPVAVGPYPAGAPVIRLPCGSTAAAGTSLVALENRRVSRAATPLTLVTWRELHFGEQHAPADAANHADPDHDGVVNLLEFAFGLDPLRPDADKLPEMKSTPTGWVIAYTPPPGLQPLVYGASVSRDLQHWEPLENTGSAPHCEFRLPLAASRAFMRLEVVEPKP